MRKSRIFLYALLLVILLGVLYVSLGKTVGKEQSSGSGSVSDSKVIDEAFQIIKKQAVFSKSDKLIVEGAIEGMAEALEDPHSTYLTEEEAIAQESSLAEERVGIGAEIMSSTGKFIVVAPIKDSPAFKAGLKPLDEIVRVNGEKLDGKSMRDLVQLLSGKEGTNVNLTVFRSSEDRHVELHMKRALIAQHTVTSEVYTLDDFSVGIVTISLFGEKTAEEWEKQTKSLMDRGIDGLLVDVRGNPGGYLFSVSSIVGTLLENGSTFAYMQDSKGVLEMLKTEQKKPYLNKIPTVLLQNGGSASASEVLAGALRDHKRAMIIGEKSFGKGTVQETHPLSNGGKLKISTHKWLTPKQEWIHGKGISAGLEVEQDELFTMDVKFQQGEFQVGDYGEEIQYVQQVLSTLGYNIIRKDGYFGEDTLEAIEGYRKENSLSKGTGINNELFQSLSKTVTDYKARKENDKQLLMGLSYLQHNMKK